jgi:hypothetical protein
MVFVIEVFFFYLDLLLLSKEIQVTEVALDEVFHIWLD